MLLIASCAALTALAGIFVLLPLFRESERSLDVVLMAETEADRLVERKAAIYANLKDLALEHEMRRLSDDDFRRLEAGYKSDAAVILQKLEQMGVSEALDASIEKAVAARKNGKQADTDRKRRESRCPSCGADVISGKKFCADCGQKL